MVGIADIVSEIHRSPFQYTAYLAGVLGFLRGYLNLSRQRGGILELGGWSAMARQHRRQFTSAMNLACFTGVTLLVSASIFLAVTGRWVLVTPFVLFFAQGAILRVQERRGSKSMRLQGTYFEVVKVLVDVPITIFGGVVLLKQSIAASAPPKSILMLIGANPSWIVMVLLVAAMLAVFHALNMIILRMLSNT